MAEEPQKPASAEEVVAVPAENPPSEAEADNIEAEKAQSGVEDKISQSVSFKEETNVVGDLPEAQKKALDELKKLVQEALNNHELTAPKPEPEKKKPAAEKKEEVEVTEGKKEAEVIEENKEQEECHGCGVGEQSKKGEIR